MTERHPCLLRGPNRRGQRSSSRRGWLATESPRASRRDAGRGVGGVRRGCALSCRPRSPGRFPLAWGLNQSTLRFAPMGVGLDSHLSGAPGGQRSVRCRGSSRPSWDRSSEACPELCEVRSSGCYACQTLTVDPSPFLKSLAMLLHPGQATNAQRHWKIARNYAGLVGATMPLSSRDLSPKVGVSATQARNLPG